jgi:hypothetical protein
MYTYEIDATVIEIGNEKIVIGKIKYPAIEIIMQVHDEAQNRHNLFGSNFHSSSRRYLTKPTVQPMIKASPTIMQI